MGGQLATADSDGKRQRDGQRCSRWRSRGWCIIIAGQALSMNRTLAIVTVALTLLVGVAWSVRGRQAKTWR